MLRNQSKQYLEDRRQNDEEQQKLKVRTGFKVRSFSEASLSALPPTSNENELGRGEVRYDSIPSRYPKTSKRLSFPMGNISLQTPREPVPSRPHISKSPLRDHAQACGFPTNMPSRLSHGLNFSREATNLHHSFLAEQSSPDLLPTPARCDIKTLDKAHGLYLNGSGDHSHDSGSFWSMMEDVDRDKVSNSLGSFNMTTGSDSLDSCSDEDHLMDDIDDSMLITPQVEVGEVISSFPKEISGNFWPEELYNSRTSTNVPWNKFQNRKNWGHESNNIVISSLNKSSSTPQSSVGINGCSSLEGWTDPMTTKEPGFSLESNKVYTSSSENGDKAPKCVENLENTSSISGREGQRGVIRRPVTRRGNMLPKTKGFARIRAALVEESTPVESEVRREAEVVRQARESDLGIGHKNSLATAPLSSLSPNLNKPAQGSRNDGIMVSTLSHNLEGFRERAVLKSRGKGFWEAFRDESSHSSPLLPSFPCASLSGINDDILLDSASFSTASMLACQTTDHQSSSPSRSATPQSRTGSTAAELTYRLNRKRMRDYDFDLIDIKRRAVSPSMSTHNSPIIQSPMQRDNIAWGSRPSSKCGLNETGKPNGNSVPKWVGFQGVMDTNDGLMKMSIE
ncbi:BgTH12-05043 [Blumeria graminis f. sp. triticale]|uniref:Uncharacterized protein n=3 Tax=Blumeria graminis TaxID=34373 RepID=A0A656KGF3_BLUGR|nr:hypothetical protein BGT96224_A20984 [Blumeria graminis f. sp. tritici 96224]CAD6502451.1 BgTH12-05043 [Blumeria graminis f. sp. triticale]VDB87753.1 BgtA-20984 [Blumeria graminis f. sp. tritici]